MDRLLITLILIQKYLMKADDSEEEVDDDNISEEVLISSPPNTTAHLQHMDAGIIHSFKSNEDVNNINDMDSTEDIEKSNFEGLKYIINNLPEANKVQEYLQQLDFSIG
ncbi:hypothetical protein GLOIN_2v1776520 [Rhizophagus irregularis DAOM 181602=DAOM 197198]|uniref:Uncharacterized protein n=1 Tax=Rhizophagus irregularis (strain DAOM 181602 / DAOM 197198 / MUCL 43194) TaxID=747089 RepID=A0A2P4PWT1_RHIID|nr:hypothetical protein GLOIN_2v1776520 [Rhizophagus irregularis DAOM 181602=DAOM 197198]POG69826.1 hypothetical protein GLOIN_2v1776520 [Rhizophagus irregularis DAOM 181602=DAOM 197198]GET58404.1 hypothetical protein GLOIN_2v1776520 [Rhizophagus irregularis DAOM 181602=DAOM 197198]CAG8729502.1 20624_t:CDS:2 [Rhizophagus irregularis]|eukprot:XP_025176692.1 hypothetical protein GLOIN_2v1776520 [Rhizophagus irregularis DAOM 181602=DAOM 197198]